MQFNALTPPPSVSYPAYPGGTTTNDPILARNPHLTMPLVLPGLHALAARAQKAADDERKYEQIQRAKFKSVEQGMDYEGFHNMVLGAHLTPVNFSANPLSSLYEAATQKQRQGVVTAELGLDCGSLTTVTEGVGDVSSAPLIASGYLSSSGTSSTTAMPTSISAHRDNAMAAPASGASPSSFFVPSSSSSSSATSALSLASILALDRAERHSAVCYTTSQPYLPDTNVLAHISATRPDAAHLQGQFSEKRDDLGFSRTSGGEVMDDGLDSSISTSSAFVSTTSSTSASTSVGMVSNENLNTDTNASTHSTHPTWMYNASVAAGSRVKSLHDLEREWRNIADSGKILVLCGIFKEQFPEIFSVSLGFDTVSTVLHVLGKTVEILQEFIFSGKVDIGCEVLENIPISHIIQQLYYTLHYLSISPRISLTINFLEEKDQNILSEVGKMIKSWLDNGGLSIIERQRSENVVNKNDGSVGKSDVCDGKDTTDTTPKDSQSGKSKKKKLGSSLKSGISNSGVPMQYDMMLPGWDAATLALIAANSTTGDVDGMSHSELRYNEKGYSGSNSRGTGGGVMEQDLVIGGSPTTDTTTGTGAMVKKKNKSRKSKGVWVSADGVDAALKLLGA